MDAYGILVIILSVTLAIFLVLAIIATTQIIKVVKKVNIITDKAMNAVDSVETIADNIKAATGASVVGGIGAKIWEKFNKYQSKKN